jgi:hypothetical protein
VSAARRCSAQNLAGTRDIAHFLPAVLASVSLLAPPYGMSPSHRRGAVRARTQVREISTCSPNMPSYDITLQIAAGRAAHQRRGLPRPLHARVRPGRG